ncbi:lipocalin family protein [Microbulbifer sp. SAOS-129_SWC]|uniref:lipocalin family protein n=1 Tax=Microbulbifer sp. SAOS-129_SWC TaxID=3145235 RepID=UPI003217EA60
MRKLCVMLMAGLTALLGGCSGVPAGVQPVDDFQLQRYLGRWYEIARLDNRFERGLSRVTAEYSLNDDGSVKVVNRGFDAEKGKWRQSVGKAKFAGADDVGQLEVSFFGPFYASYIVVALDREHYDYALVSGYNKEYLWLLARKPQLPQATIDRLVAKARAAGFDTDKLLFVEQAAE